MLKGHGRYGITAASETPVRRGLGDRLSKMAVMAGLETPRNNKRMREVASDGGGSPSNTAVRSMAMNFELPAMDGLVPPSRKAKMQICRDIYEYDTVCGAAVDLMSNLPFSGFTLTGINDRKILGTFVKSVENTRLPTIFPYLSRDFLVDGAMSGTFEFDKNRGIYNNLITHNGLNIEVQDVPIYGMDPLLTLTLPKGISDIIGAAGSKGKNKDPRIDNVLKNLPELFKKVDKGGKILLDPLSTLYIARKSFTFDTVGMSYLHRIIPLWLMEKALLRGSIEQSYQRQRAITHVIAGTDEWEPTEDELRQIVSLVVNANMDPTGAVIATRPDISFSELIRGDDFYKHCLAEGTLIQTEKGLVPIENLESINTKPMKIMGGKGLAKAVKWHKTGKKKVFDYKLKDGQTVRSTRLHRFMVLDENYNLVWKKGYQLQEGDLVCVSTKQSGNNTPYKFEKFDPSVYGNEGALNLPSHMNPELAYGLGLFVSEGWSNKYTVQFGNSDAKLVKKFDKIMQSQFGLEPSRSMVPAGCDSGGMTSTKAFYDHKYCRKQLCEFFEHIGVLQATAKHKEVPFSILQSDRESQLAYLAGYIDGDGWITEANIGIASSSRRNLQQMQAMAAAMGYTSHIKGSTLTFNRDSSYRLNSEIRPYLVAKIKKIQKPEFATCRGGGIPTAPITALIEERRLPVRRMGVVLRCDDGSELEVRSFAKLFKNLRKTWSTECFLEGDYNQQLDVLAKVSPDLHEKILDLFSRSFDFSPLESVEEIGMVETYDLTMDSKAENSFVAEGVIVHNSDVYSYLAEAKLRGLNISDSFLSGDATFTTMEVALSVFMEQVRQYRDVVTREIFYEKMFPSIALANGFKKSRRDMQVTSRYFHETSSGRLMAICDGSNLNAINEIEDITEYYQPKVEWHKQLSPQADREYLDLLASMREQGIPIPIRMMAAAAGLNIDQIIAMMDDDMTTRETLSDHLKEINKMLAESEGGGGEGGEFASKIISPKNRRKLAKRREITQEQVTGRVLEYFDEISKNGGKVKRKGSRAKDLAEAQGFEVSDRHKSGGRRFARGSYQRQLEETQDRKLAAALGRISRGELPPATVRKAKILATEASIA